MAKIYSFQVLLYLIGCLLLVNCNYWSNVITTPAQITEIDKKPIAFNVNRRKKRKKFITSGSNCSFDKSKNVYAFPKNHSIITHNSNNGYYRNIKPKYPVRPRSGPPPSSHHTSYMATVAAGGVGGGGGGGSAIISNTSISSSPNYRIYSNYNNSIIKSPYNGLKIQESTDVVIYRSVPINCKHHSQSSSSSSASNVNYYQLNRERRPTFKPKQKGKKK